MNNITCPVCGIQPSQELTNCTQCGWDLRPVFGLSTKVHAEYQARLERAKAAWQARVAPKQTMQARYIDHQEGTVTDSQTGLMWMKLSVGQHWLEGKVVGEAETFTWEQACQQNCTCFAGYDDWRLPSIEELKTLVLCSSGKRDSFDSEGRGGTCFGDCQILSLDVGPTIDLGAFPNTPPNWFWSSTPAACDSRSSWGVGFDGGYVNYLIKSNFGQVRLVRARQ